MTWYVVGGSIGAIGLLVMLMALFFDRARGRRRCPKCWYDMAHREKGGLACPECGHRVKREQRLAKTRRHRWFAALGAVILVAGAGMAGTERVRQHGWVDVAPTTVLLLMVPSIDDPKSPLATELGSRIRVEEPRFSWQADPEDLGLWSWQRRLLAARCVRALEEDRPRATRLLAARICRRLGPEAAPAHGELLELLASGDRQLMYVAASAIGRIGPVDPGSVPALAAFVAADRDTGATEVIRVLGRYGADARPAIPVLIDVLRKSTEKLRGDPAYGRYTLEPMQEESIRALGRIGPHAADALPDLIQIVRDRSCYARPTAATAIGEIDVTQPDASETIIAALQSIEVGLRSAAADVVRRHPLLLERSIETLVRNLEEGSALERVESARSLMTLGADARPAVSALRQALGDEDIVVRLFAARALGTIGAPARGAAAELQVATKDSDESVRREAVRALAALQGGEG